MMMKKYQKFIFGVATVLGTRCIGIPQYCFLYSGGKHCVRYRLAWAFRAVDAGDCDWRSSRIPQRYVLISRPPFDIAMAFRNFRKVIFIA